MVPPVAMITTVRALLLSILSFLFLILLLIALGEDPFRIRLPPRIRQGTDLSAQRQDKRGADRQFVDAHLEEGPGQGQVRGKLSADPDLAVVAVSGLDTHPDGTQQRGMMGVKKRLQLRVLPVNRAEILHQVIGADGKEIHLFGKLVRT